MGNFRVKVHQFYKKNKKKIWTTFLIIWLIIFIINLILKNRKPEVSLPSTTYSPHTLMYSDNGEEVPEKYQKPIENLIDTYFNYCNSGDYQNAYNIITDECKKSVYPTLELFKSYVDTVFEGKKKIYNIQSCSVVDNKYIYNIRILDDILANGTTDGYSYYEEKLILIEENGEFKLSIGEFIEEKDPNIVVEDDNMIIEITNVYVDYDTETYTIKIKNKTDKYIVISDNTQSNEIMLDVGDYMKHPNNTEYVNFYIKPNSTTSEDIKFDKFYDNGLTSKRILLNTIRILNEYDAKQGTTQENLDNAVKLYGFDIKLTK